MSNLEKILHKARIAMKEGATWEAYERITEALEALKRGRA